MNPEESEVLFAYWLDPASGTKVTYSLQLFHEIDFQVNEGYRRIPHGGIEVGGVLYGTFSRNAIQIEQFRPIDCEHASGPSFNLSERDLETLRSSILSASNDPELAALVPVGWFISHTRSALRLTEWEVDLFGRFFPESQRVAVLAKPERFKPTRFAFLVRDATGKVPVDGERSAIILPLPGRPGKTAPSEAPAIPAPIPVNTVKNATPLAEPKAGVEPPDSADARFTPPIEVPFTPPEPPPPAAPQISPARAQAITPPQSAPTADLWPPLPLRPSPERATGSGGARRLIAILILAALLGCVGGYWAYLRLPSPVIPLRVQVQSQGLLVLWDPAQTEAARYAFVRVNDSSPVLLTPEQMASGLVQVPLTGESVKVEIVSQHWVRESRGIVRFVAAPRTP